MWNRLYNWLWRSYRKLPVWLWTILDWMHFGIAGRQKQIAEQRSATNPRLQGGVPQKTHRDRIRQLLCDNAACKLCERAAEEAAQFLYSKGADSLDPADPALPGVSFERGHVSFRQRVSTPASVSETMRVAKHVAYGWEERSDWAVDRDGRNKDTFSLSSTTYSTSFTSCTESSSGLSAGRRVKDFRSSSPITKQMKGHGVLSQLDKEAFAETFHHKRVNKTTVFTVQRDVGAEGHELTTSAQVLDSKTISGSQAKLQDHFMKKSLERRLEVFPAIVGHSQKMTTSWARKRPLPKLIHFGQHCPQLRNRVCFCLPGEADALEMNIKCKYLHFLWGLPTLYTQSLAKIAPGPPSLPTAPSRVPVFIECGHAEPLSTARREWRVLESHVLRKRLQHQWGLPGLVQQSLKGFLRPVPPSAQVASVSRARLEVRVFTGFSQLLFFTLGIKQQQLETHIRSKIVERRWGLPRRVLESLRAFLPVPPPLIRRPREGEKACLLPMMEKAEKRMPSMTTSGSSQKSAASSEKPPAKQGWDHRRQALRGHVAKKALEIRFGMASSVVQQSQKTAYQAGKRVLSKVIPPRSKPLKPRSQELPFLNENILGCIQLNITHKILTCKWGLPTVYHKPLVQLLQRSVPAAHAASWSPRSAAFSFTGRETLFLGQSTREVLEWHVKRKRLHHSWGLPGLVQRSLCAFRPAAPRTPLKTRHREVAVFQTELSFLSQATKQVLERNVQKRVLHQRWLLPRRVLESLKHLSPRYGLGSTTCPGPCRAGAVGKEQGAGRKAARMAKAPRQVQPLPTVQVHLQLHLAKKSLEVHLEALPSVVRVSWRASLPVKRPLPKTIPPGEKPLLPRRSLLPFAGREEMDRIDLAVRRNQLAGLWELGRRYVEALGGMALRPSSHSPRKRRVTFDFTKARVSLPPGLDQEALEHHVQRKRIQHEWGLPALVHRSLLGFLHGPPPPASSIHTNICVHVLLPERLFLPPKICHQLEIHLQKMKLHRVWGLPRRVLDSLRLLQPGLKAGAPGQKPSGLPCEPGAGGLSGRAGSETLSASAVQRRRAAATPGILQGVPRKGCQSLEKIQVHLAKKRVEMQLGAFPAVVVRSWRCTFLASRQPLPRLVLCGCRPLQLRKCFLPFVPREQADRVEMSVRLCHLSSLWGLGTRHVEALQALLPPRPFSQPLGCRRAALRPSQVQGRRVQRENQRLLELHVRKKRLQHAWGFPLLVQRSLRAFLQEFPPGPPFPKVTVRIQVLQRDLLFLPQSTCSHLEHHIQRQKLQRQWGLPKRVLDSLRLLIPEPPREWKETLSVRSRSGEPSRGTRPRARPVGAIDTERDRKKGPRTPGVAPQQARPRLVSRAKAAEKLQLHLAKKYLEVHLEVFPAVFRISGRRASLPQSQPLPKPIRPELRPLKPRRSSFSVGREDMNRIELAVQRRHLASLWGLGTRCVEAVAGMAPKLPRPVARLRVAAFEFSEVKTPFCRQRVRETLELHIGRKRIQHAWGFPVLVQRSLRGFIQQTPTRSGPPKSAIEAHVLHQELLFLPGDTYSHLEHHIQKMKLQRKWGLPGRVLGSLKPFLPSPSLSRAWFPQSDKKFVQAESGTGEAEVVNMWQVETNKVSLELLSVVDNTRSSPVPIRQAGPRFQKLQSPFSRKESREMLEYHIQKKRLQHFWGLPSAVQRSLRVFAPPTSACTHPSHRTDRKIKIQIEHLLFVSEIVQKKLESNLKKMIVHSRWGLPKKMHKFLCNLVPHPLTVRGVQEQKSVGGGAFSHEQDMREYIVRLPQVTYEEAPCKEVSSGAPMTFPPKVVELFENSMINILETHLKKKSLQIKFQLIPPVVRPKTFAGSIKPVPLPKLPLRCSMVKPRRAFPLLVEEELLAKIQLNISCKYLTYLWGLPSFHTESLRKLFGKVPEPLMPRNVATLRGTLKVPMLGRQATGEAVHLGRLTATSMVPRGARSKPPKLGPPFLTDESLDLLESHIRNKKLQHMWGLPATIQKSLRKFAPIHSELQRSLEQLGVAATRSQSAREVKVAAQRLLVLDPALTEHLETHMKSQIAAHRWHLPRRIQESLKRFLPPESLFQAEGSKEQAQTLRGSRVQTLQAAPALKKADGLLGHRVHQVKIATKFPPRETSRLLEFHLRQKRVQHEWGLPSIVQRSLRAFALPSPEPRPRSTNAGATVFVTSEQVAGTGEGSTDVQILSCTGEVITPSHNLPFLSPETVDSLEGHVRSRAAKHKWKVPKLVQNLLRALDPLQSEAAEKQKGTFYPGKQMAATCVCAELAAFFPPEWEPTFLPRESQSLLEFHIQRKKIQHTWGLPSTVLKSLCVFAPFPQSGAKKHTPSIKGATTAPKLPWAREEVHSTTQSLFFLSSDTKEHLESHVRRITAKHRWGLPKHVQKSLKAFLPAVLPAGGSRPQTQPWLHLDSQSLQDTFLQPQFETEHSVWRFQDQRGTSEKKRPEATLVISASIHSVDFVDDLPWLTAADKHVLELHIQCKKIQHEWGLPAAIQRSLRAFALPPPEPSPKSTNDGAAAFVTSEQVAGTGEGSTDVQILSCTGEVITPSHNLPFLSPETVDSLEGHVRSRAAKHKWKVPKLVQDLLRALDPLQSEPAEKQKGTFYPGKQMAATCVCAELTAFLPPEWEPTFLPRESQSLLEFHIQRKKIQHTWGLPSTVLKSLCVFAPFPQSGAKKHTQSTEGTTTAPKLSWAREEVHSTTQNLSFFSSDTKEHLESHVRRITAKHRWGLPKHVQKSLKAFLPAVLPAGGSRPQTQPWLHLDSQSLQDTFLKPHFETEHSVRRFQDKRETAEKKRPEATSVITASIRSVDFVDELPWLTAADKRVLELHIQRKKVQHEWGLPAAIWRSLQAFAPVPQEPQGSLPSAEGERVAGRPKNILAGMRAGARKPWVVQEVSPAAQKLLFLNSETKEALEAHVRTLTTEHRWHLPGLLQKSARPFVAAASPSQAGGTRDQRLISTCDKTLKVAGVPLQAEREREAPSSSKVSHRFRSELFYQMGPDGGSASWQAAKEPLLHPAEEPQHSAGATGTYGSWKAGTAAPRKGSVQKKPLHRSLLQVHLKKTTNGAHSRISVKTCQCHLATSRKDSTYSLHSDAEKRCWQQEEGGQGKTAKRMGDKSQSFPILSTRESMKDAPLPEQEAAAWANSGPLESGPISRATMGSSTEISHGFKSHSAYEDMVAMHYRQSGRGNQGRGSRKLRRRGSTLGWSKENREALPCQAPGDGAVSNVNEGQTFQGNPPQGLQPQTGTAKEEAQRPLSTGGMSQFSTECEWERVGDWDSEEEAAQESTGLGEEEGRSAKAAEEEVGPWHEDSPAVEQPLASLESALVREATAILRDQMLHLTAGQAGSEPFGHQIASRSETGEMVTLGWSKESKEALPRQTPGDEATANISSGQTFQGGSAHGLQSQTGTAEGEEAQHPLSTGGVSQFSSERKRERAGVWNSEKAVGESTGLGEEEGGSAKAAEEEVGPRHEDSPAAEQPLTSLESALIREATAILRNQMLHLTAGQAASEPFGHRMAPQSETGEMGSDTEPQLLPEQPSGASQSLVFGEEMQASAEIEQAEILLCGEREERIAVGEAATVTTGPGTKMHERTRKEELNCERKASPKEPSGGQEFKMVDVQSTGQPVEQDQEPQFVGGVCIDEKCFILGRILEEKLSLKHGFRVWMRSNERLGDSQEEKGQE